MPALSHLESILRQADRILGRSEDLVIRAIERTVRARLRDLEDRLRRLDEQSRDVRRISDTRKREARARELVVQLETALAAFDLSADATGIPDRIRDMLANADELGARTAQRLGEAFGESMDIRASVDLEAVQAVITNTKARLHRHSGEFRQAAEDLVIQGIVQGKGPRNQARLLREQTGALLWKAEQVVRTETIQAQDRSSRNTYGQNGIVYVQRMGTLDRKICVFCLSRHGNVYRLEAAPAAIHPSDRCYNMPWRPEWLDSGIIDLEGLRESRRLILEKAEKAPNRGVAPFEKAAGQKSPPEVVWRIPEAA